MSVSQNQIEELRSLFLNDLNTKEKKNVHPKDLERLKNNDDWLRRFILHNEGNVQLAHNMLWTSITWRYDYKVNEIRESDIKMEMLCSGAFFLHGCDVDGFKLMVFKCNKHVKGSGNMEEIKRCVVYWFERIEREVNGQQITIFFDMEGCGLSNMDMELIKYLIGLFKEYYPYFLNYIIIFEMAWVLSAAFKIVKSWLPQKAVEKIKFVNKKDIKTYVPLDQALKSWGGDNDYVFSFVPESVDEAEQVVEQSRVTVNNKKVHFVDGSMSEISAGSGDKEFDGGSLKVTPSGIITFVKDGNELVSNLELQNVDTINHISYKLKTTAPEKFRVKPSTGCLSPGESATVAVTLLPGFHLGGLSRDKFLVMSTPIEPSELGSLDLAEIWKNSSGRKVNQHRLKCIQNGELTKNGNIVPATAHSSDTDQNNFDKLSASVAQLNNCQMELHKAIRITQYYQIATVFLVLLLGIALGYVLHTNIREISSSHSYCREFNRP